MEDGAVRAGEVSGALREGVGGAVRAYLCVCWVVAVVGGGGGFPGRLGARFCGFECAVQWCNLCFVAGSYSTTTTT